MQTLTTNDKFTTNKPVEFKYYRAALVQSAAHAISITGIVYRAIVCPSIRLSHASAV